MYMCYLYYTVYICVYFITLFYMYVWKRSPVNVYHCVILSPSLHIIICVLYDTDTYKYVYIISHSVLFDTINLCVYNNTKVTYILICVYYITVYTYKMYVFYHIVYRSTVFSDLRLHLSHKFTAWGHRCNWLGLKIARKYIHPSMTSLSKNRIHISCYWQCVLKIVQTLWHICLKIEFIHVTTDNVF